MTRYYTPDTVGRRCRFCLLRMPLALLNRGIYVHPTCGDPDIPGGPS